ncbi:hypothetical protein PP178_04315 [Zeaxanthinibacter sp. PT1]|uniref:hypothetical protein n=1 Tax=Zeaxanthinibacter TaxID=561554 RepID=UPI00234B1A5C|nr:hypothetical protein [Zeaxanthinibacter sp. PT1]MDC6350764.1 hypothetical protein [Zeaxanthinibacter sp. PT1]
MRRTGRTSRIIAAALDRLWSEGEVIVHDHADYPQTHQSNSRFLRLFENRFLDSIGDKGTSLESYTTSMRSRHGHAIMINHIKTVYKNPNK